MNPVPIILAKTDYDFDTLFKSTKQGLGINVNRTIDSRRLQKPSQKFYAALSEFRNEDYQHSPDMDGLVLEFFSYTLGLIIEDHVYSELLHERRLIIIGSPTIRRGYTYCIATASLRNWRDAVVDGSTRESTHELRCLMNSVYNLFASEGLITMWSNYTKLNVSDNTMILIEQ